MKVLLKPEKSNNFIATIAIGKDYFDLWHKNAYSGWKKYCEKHDLGLVIFDENLISTQDPVWKKATWQKLLIAEKLKDSSLLVESVCYIDTDILINEQAPNIFDKYDPVTIGLVSMVKNIPFSMDEARRIVSFMRHKYYDKKYPLDSAIFMTVEQIFSYHNLPAQNDFACMGLIVFNVDYHADLMRKWFNKYDKNVDSLTGGGDQSHINFEIQNWGNITWLDYKYQALWTYEMAIKYPFLYNYGRYDKGLIRECIEATLTTNYFLHFASSWSDSDMWKFGGIFDSKAKKMELKEYYDYLKIPVFGISRGQIKPPVV